MSNYDVKGKPGKVKWQKKLKRDKRGKKEKEMELSANTVAFIDFRKRLKHC